MPVFDIYTIRGEETSQLIKQSGFDGAQVDIRSLETRFSALDFDGNKRLWMGTPDSIDGAGIVHEFDPESFAQLDNSFYSTDGKLIDVLGWPDPISLHLQDADNYEESESEDMPSLPAAAGQRLALYVNHRWGGWTAFQTPAVDSCGFGLAKWHGEPLFLNDCKLIRFDYSISGEWQQPLVALHFSDDFAEQPRILAMDDMPWAKGLAVLVEDTENGSVRRHLGFIDMLTGDVVRLGGMPIDARGIAVKFKDFQNEPIWTSPPAPH
jgi:hypothetical protein